MTVAEKQEYINRFNRLWKRYERRYVPRLTEIIRAQVDAFIASFKQSPTPLAANDIDALPMYELMRELYIGAGTDWAAVSQAQITRQTRQKSRRPIGFNQQMFTLITAYFERYLFNDVQGITDTTRRNLLDIFVEAQRNGLSIDETIALFQEYRLDMSVIRARLIARTETITAANTGAQLNAEQSELQLRKTWLATNDMRTRRDHAAMDDRQVGVNDTFMVAGSIPMKHPGDRGSEGQRTPAAQVCNCRCTCVYEVERDGDGRVIERNPGLRRRR
jgi:uncharacterized protein with gpF-like domain